MKMLMKVHFRVKFSNPERNTGTEPVHSLLFSTVPDSRMTRSPPAWSPPPGASAAPPGRREQRPAPPPGSAPSSAHCQNHLIYRKDICLKYYSLYGCTVLKID